MKVWKRNISRESGGKIERGIGTGRKKKKRVARCIFTMYVRRRTGSFYGATSPSRTIFFRREAFLRGVRTRKLFPRTTTNREKSGVVFGNRTILALSRRGDKLSLSLSFFGLFCQTVKSILSRRHSVENIDEESLQSNIRIFRRKRGVGKNVSNGWIEKETNSLQSVATMLDKRN